MTFLTTTALCAAALLSHSAQAAYVITPTIVGGSNLVAPGSTFNIDVALTSNAADQHNSAIFRIEFSEPGLEYLSYVWQSPYSNGTIDDNSQPIATALPLQLNTDTLSGPGNPTNTVDIEMSNVLPDGNFTEGTLVRLTLHVPQNYAGAEMMMISVVPDTIADGFTVINTTPGTPLHIRIPGPATWIGILGACMLCRRRHQ